MISFDSLFSNLLYVQRHCSGDVYVVNGYLETSLAKREFDLRNKKLIQFEQAEVNKVVLFYDRERIEAVKKEAEWFLAPQ